MAAHAVARSVGSGSAVVVSRWCCGPERRCGQRHRRRERAPSGRGGDECAGAAGPGTPGPTRTWPRRRRRRRAFWGRASCTPRSGRQRRALPWCPSGPARRSCECRCPRRRWWTSHRPPRTRRQGRRFVPIPRSRRSGRIPWPSRRPARTSRRSARTSHLRPRWRRPTMRHPHRERCRPGRDPTRWTNPGRGSTGRARSATVSPRARRCGGAAPSSRRVVPATRPPRRDRRTCRRRGTSGVPDGHRKSDEASRGRRPHASRRARAFASQWFRWSWTREGSVTRAAHAARRPEASGRGDADPARSSLPGEAARPGRTVPPESLISSGRERPAQPCSLPGGPRHRMRRDVHVGRSPTPGTIRDGRRT